MTAPNKSYAGEPALAAAKVVTCPTPNPKMKHEQPTQPLQVTILRWRTNPKADEAVADCFSHVYLSPDLFYQYSLVSCIIFIYRLYYDMQKKELALLFLILYQTQAQDVSSHSLRNQHIRHIRQIFYPPFGPSPFYPSYPGYGTGGGLLGNIFSMSFDGDKGRLGPWGPSRTDISNLPDSIVDGLTEFILDALDLNHNELYGSRLHLLKNSQNSFWLSLAENEQGREKVFNSLLEKKSKWSVSAKTCIAEALEDVRYYRLHEGHLVPPKSCRSASDKGVRSVQIKEDALEEVK
ncbi:unnamed protein product [Cylicocyclus nassatus]|uniref:Uncharacterized protein n=1 Tax=Cylicocyclus nassatus TaxID=53992 RepID=A0AA36HAR3_CYLNA|nr:unnamed protein product [Cylicocyclus nassatus]